MLHIHVRELDGKGSKRLSKFNELLGRLREAVPDMILQVGGSISFAPEGDGADAKWLGDDARHMLAELDPQPDQVTIAINTNQMNIVELMTDDDIAGTSFERPEVYEAYREMFVPAGPEWVEEHLQAAARPTASSRTSSSPASAQLETVERLIRRGDYTGPLNLTWVAIGGGFDGPNPYNMMNFISRVPDGACLTLETLMRSVLPVNTMAIAMGLHTRCGNEDTLWGRKGEKITSVQQVEQLVRIANELGREVATGKEARDIYRIGETYDSADETLAKPRLRAQPQARPARLHLPRLSHPATRSPTDARGARATDAPAPHVRRGQLHARASVTTHTPWSIMCQPPPRDAPRDRSARPPPAPAADPVPGLPAGRLRPHLRAAAVGLHVAPGALGGLPLPQGRVGADRHPARRADQHRRADRRPARRPAVAARRPLGPLQGDHPMAALWSLATARLARSRPTTSR